MQCNILDDTTKTELVCSGSRSLADYDMHAKSRRKVFEVPFNSTNKWALVIVSVSVGLFWACRLMRCEGRKAP
jgi:hypothetical protein